MAPRQILGETGIEGGGPELPAYTTWLARTELWQNPPISRRAGTQSERNRQNLGNGSRMNLKKLTNNSA